MSANDDAHRRLSDNVWKMFGITFGDALKIIGMAVAIYIFLWKSDFRLTKVEETQQTLAEIVNKLSDFRSNSDNYHGRVTGYEFKDGRPIEPVHSSRIKELGITPTTRSTE